MSNEGARLQGTSGNDEIGTPRWLFHKINAAYVLTYDAFASHENALCDSYSTIEGTYYADIAARSGVCGEPFQLSDLDGLTTSWRGQRVFCNPPYGRGDIKGRNLYDDCVDKMIEERNNAAIIVALLKVDTSTKRWQKVMQYAHIDYLPRIKYAGMSGKATFASAVCVFKKDWA